jgi:hypothetical protein
VAHVVLPGGVLSGYDDDLSALDDLDTASLTYAANPAGSPGVWRSHLISRAAENRKKPDNRLSVHCVLSGPVDYPALPVRGSNWTRTPRRIATTAMYTIADAKACAYESGVPP